MNLNSYVDAFPTVRLFKDVTLGNMGVEGVLTGASGKTTLPNSLLQVVLELSYMKQIEKYEDMG